MFIFNIELTWITLTLYIVFAFITLVLKFRSHVKDIIKENSGEKKTLSEMTKLVFADINPDVIFFWFIAWPYVVAVYLLTRFLRDLWNGFWRTVAEMSKAFWKFVSTAAKAFYNKVKFFLVNIVHNMLTKAGFKD